MKSKKLNKRNLFIVIFILIVLSSFVVYYFLKPIEIKEEEKKNIIYGNISEDPLDVKDYLKVEEVKIFQNNVILVSGCNISMESTTEQQAYSIQAGLEKTIMYRPTVHDVIENIFENYDFEVIMVKIIGMKEGTYFANLIIKQNNKILNSDIKPSDAIAIAIRINAPVYVKKDFFKYIKEECG